jgi:hypothetical protein
MLINGIYTKARFISFLAGPALMIKKTNQHKSKPICVASQNRQKLHQISKTGHFGSCFIVGYAIMAPIWLIFSLASGLQCLGQKQ